MSYWFVDLDKAAGMMGHDWTLEKVIEKIKEGALTAYARISCQLPNHSTDDDSDDDDAYEIVRIANIKLCHQSNNSLKTFKIQYEPISFGNSNIECDDKYCDANKATDKYYDPVKCNYIERVYGCLKSRSEYLDFISIEEICLLNSDILQFSSCSHDFIKKPAQILARQRHSTDKCDEIVDKIMKSINEELKKHHKECVVINHIRFIEEAYVPENLYDSILSKVKKRIKTDYNHHYKPLSRAPKKETEDYFLLK